jgi:hypothetical protein
VRRSFNRAEYERAKREFGKALFATPEEEDKFVRREREIRAARLPDKERERRLRRLECDVSLRPYEKAYERAKAGTFVSGLPEVRNSLLRAETAEQVREICNGAFETKILEIAQPCVYDGGPPFEIVGSEEVRVLKWPIPDNSLPRALATYTEEFIAAKNDRRYPASNRATSELKQLWFLARALAGATLGLSVRTSINLVGSLRPEKLLEQTQAGKPARRKRGKKHGSRKR